MFSKFKLRLLIWMLLVFVLSSCATILGGKSNTLIISGSESTKASVYIDDVKVGEVPGKLVLPKETIQHGSILEIKADGFAAEEYVLLRKQNALYSIADLLTGGIPLLVDYTTGNLYRPYPRKFNYQPEKEEE